MRAGNQALVRDPCGTCQATASKGVDGVHGPRRQVNGVARVLQEKQAPFCELAEYRKAVGLGVDTVEMFPIGVSRRVNGPEFDASRVAD